MTAGEQVKPEQVKPDLATKPETTTAVTPTVHLDFAPATVGWNLYGAGFGDTAGVVTLNGKPLTPTRWEDRRINGPMTPDVKPGVLVVLTSTGVRIEGHYP